ncbi:hypothetical protein ACOME3_007965 [Neoechinorhynchus agilis]
MDKALHKEIDAETALLKAIVYKTSNALRRTKALQYVRMACSTVRSRSIQQRLHSIEVAYNYCCAQVKLGFFVPTFLMLAAGCAKLHHLLRRVLKWSNIAEDDDDLGAKISQVDLLSTIERSHENHLLNKINSVSSKVMAISLITKLWNKRILKPQKYDILLSKVKNELLRKMSEMHLRKKAIKYLYSPIKK